ncbi:leucine-rich repeat-containing protein 24-like [Limulus polyphemus]|uniref:Leucine-rich repeat-containing protein 24-like n=1 Tax=Limulus polyphemus TaxID=6850 RepID=A0ABM1RW86_LIMPO|nr:leucine-rich repeat-containing protein 24-like [Limulus polyphemus]XP_022235641.1 leucine-rich repeat-containing protein 24-like [Limulus polyphemus]
MRFNIYTNPITYETFVCTILSIMFVTEALTCNITNCTCIWRNGKQTAECPSGGFTTVPRGLDSGIQVLNLTSNNFRGLGREIFVDAGLGNLQKVHLARCGIEWIDEFAFSRLTNLIELNLGYNKLQAIPSASFHHLPRLRELVLSGNSISTVPNLAFQSAKSLTYLELSRCHIHTIGDRAFEGLRNLKVLKIDQNNLKTFPGKAINHLQSLYEITIDGNPWTCDCNLRAFRQWMDKNNVPIYVPPICTNPSRLRGKSWSQINLEDYSCPPRFLNTSSVVSVFEDFNVTLECRVLGDPSPNIKWIWRDRTIANLSEGISERQVFVILEKELGRVKTATLEITFIQEPNAGSYSCIAENNAGIASQNFSLVISRRPVTEGKVSNEEKPQEVRENDTNEDVTSADGVVIGMIIGIVVGAILVLLIFSIFLWVLRRKRISSQRRHSDVSNKATNSDNNPVPKNPCDEVDLKFLNQVNPNEKLPRIRNYQNIPTGDIGQYDPMIIECEQPQQLFVVNDHLSHDTNWEMSIAEDPSFQPPPFSEKRYSRGLIPVPVPVPPQDFHSRLQTELSDTLQRKCDKKSTERERGDGSSELEAGEYEGTSKHFIETLRVKELQKTFKDDENRLSMPQLHSENKTPDLLDHSRHSQPETSRIWSRYEHPSAYFHPSHEYTTNGLQGGANGTEV